MDTGFVSFSFRNFTSSLSYLGFLFLTFSSHGLISYFSLAPCSIRAGNNASRNVFFKVSLNLKNSKVQILGFWVVFLCSFIQIIFNLIY